MDLFGFSETKSPTSEGESHAKAPLAHRMRPQTLDEYVGQEHLLGPKKALRRLIETDQVGNAILWGPPGTGKTTLARLIAGHTKAHFVTLSAVSDGIPRVREVIKEAEDRLRMTGRPTLVFVDEIHRWKRDQQDAILKASEEGIITLFGATTENPSFALNAAILSRCTVYVIEPLKLHHLKSMMRRALEDEVHGFGSWKIQVEDEALNFLAEAAQGDGRSALNVLETAAKLASHEGTIDLENAKEAVQLRFAAYDRTGDDRYQLISALQKSIRGSAAQAALYYLARMMDAGEDPMYIWRRLVVIASEDVGLADPMAIVVVMNCMQAWQMLGPAEGRYAFAQATLYLANAEKSNHAHDAINEALMVASQTRTVPVPLHLRNAETALMKQLGYKEGYDYPFDHEEHFSPTQLYLPDALRGRVFYTPSPYGYERKIAERMEARRRIRDSE